MWNRECKRILFGIIATVLLTTPGWAVEKYKVSNYGGGHQIWFEVEDFDERYPDDENHFALTDEPFAFGRSISSVSGATDVSFIRYTFDISKAGGAGGTWYFWGRVINELNYSDFMLVDGHPGDPTPVTLPVSGLTNDHRIFEENAYGKTIPWTWSGNNHAEAHTKQLRDGENTMYILPRQAGAHWDVFLWTDDSDYVPTDEDYINAEPMALGKAYNAYPADGAPDVWRDVTLTWTPGEFADKHDVYFGTVFDDVNNASAGSPLLVSPAQDANTYQPGRLEFGQTYFWRVDEVNTPPDLTIFKGDVWSFTVEPLAHPISGERITASASSNEEGKDPQNTVNSFGLDANDFHSTDVTDMWLSSVDDPGPVWIEYEFNKVYKLHEMQIWNYNGQFVLTLFGLKDVTIEYSTDGVNWTQLADVPEVAAATGMEDYVYNTTVAFGDAAVKFVKITANSNWSNGLFTQYGLSEVRFMYIPTDARYPLPEDGATDIAIDTTLEWRAGREAAEHNVYISKDEQSVLDGTASVVTVPTTSYGPLSLDLGSMYYWRVDEVNNVNAVPIWEGNIWSFTTQEYLVVDDFESYNDINEGEEGSNRIYLTWLDGYDVAANGSQVGYDDPPLAEQVIVHSGGQSMPLSYNNTGGVNNSDATRTFSTAQDWTRSGINTLTLYVYGQADNVDGQFYVKVNDIEKAVDVDLTSESWQDVNIELATLGIDLQRVTSLAIVIKGAGSGIVYVDDIRLHP